MLSGLLTAISVLSSGYTFAKRVMDDTKKNRPEAYAKLKKVPRSQRRAFLDRELVDHAKHEAKKEVLRELKDEYKAELRKQMLKELEIEAQDKAWDNVKEVLSKEKQQLENLKRIQNDKGISRK